MAGYQFMHVEVYAVAESKLKGAKRAKEGKKREKTQSGWSSKQVLAEAIREEEASMHVEKPQPPEQLFGDIYELKRSIEALESTEEVTYKKKKEDGTFEEITEQKTKYGTPKGQRKDTPILVAGVISAPWPPGDPRSKQWREDSLNWLKNEYGDKLRAVVGHNDEAYDHIHFYAAQPDWSNVKTLHRGFIARKNSAENEDKPWDQKAAFDSAMREFQDSYYNDVGMKNGFSRIGPKRRRLSREGWKDEQLQAEALAEVAKKAEQMTEKISESEGILGRIKRQIEEATAKGSRAIEWAQNHAKSIVDDANAFAVKLKKELEEGLKKLAVERQQLQKEREIFEKERQKMAVLWSEMGPERREEVSKNANEKLKKLAPK